MAALADGGYAIIWTSNNGYNLYLQRYSAFGLKVGGEVLVDGSVNAKQGAALTGLADGGYVLSWQSYGSGQGSDIYTQRYDASGAQVGGITLINSYTQDFQEAPGITWLKDGGYVVTWHSQEASPYNYGIHSQRYNAAGSKVGGEALVSDSALSRNLTPNTAALEDGGYVVTWVGANTGGGPQGIYAQRYDAAGSKVASATKVNTSSDYPAVPVVTGLDGGGYVIVWQGSDASSVGVFAQRYDASGVKVGGETLVNTYTNSDQSTPVISALSDGGYVIAWTSDGQDGSYTGVYIQRFDATGARVDSETRVNDVTANAQVATSIATLDNGSFVVTWHGYNPATGVDVFQKVYSLGNNHAPGLTGAPASLAGGTQNQPYTVSQSQLLAGFSDADGDALSLDLITANNGVVVNNGNGTYTITSPTSYSGAVVLSYYVIDSLGGSVLANLTYNLAQADITLTGDAGDNTLSGGAGADHLYGLGGKDMISGNAGNDVIEGGDGDDGLYGQDGDDVISGGAGNDIIMGDFTNSSPLPGGNDTINGGDGDDTIFGGLGRDTIHGDDGNDWIFAGGDIYGDAGNDRIETYGYTGSLTYVFGGTGDDTIIVRGNVYGGGLITAYGGDGNDNITNIIGSSGPIYGGNGDDSIGGYSGNDTLYGGNDNDTLWGGAGNDSLFGEDGNDELTGGAGADILNGGAGNDTAIYTSPYGIGLNIFAGNSAQWNGDAAGDVFISIENLTGAEYDDTLGMDDNANVLKGREGNDSLYGFGGDDALFGGDGNDHLHGGLGADTLDGGNGTDLARYDYAGSGVIVNLAAGVGSAGEAAGDSYNLIEGVVGSTYNDILMGSAGANTLYGVGGDDSLYGDFGDDNLYGGDGVDNLNGGAGADYLDGGAGTDFARYDLAGSGVVANLLTARGTLGEASGDTYVSIEGLVGSAFNDSLTGNVGNNTLFGVAGNDSLYGEAGDDQLYGGDGIDNLIGGAGADVLDGGADTDFARYDYAASGVMASLLTGKGSAGEAAGDTYVSVEGLVGSAFNDSLTGNASSNTLYGVGGNDNLYGEAGDDQLYGGDGNDNLTGGLGFDRLDGGNGFDLIRYDYSPEWVIVDLTNGTGAVGEASGDTYVSIEGAVGSAFHDLLFGDSGNNVFYGLAGDDTIEGAAGDDTLYGEAGNDTLRGGNGDDLLSGGEGSDRLDGGIGIDLASYEYAATGITADIWNSYINTGEALGDSYESIAGLVGSNFNDILIGSLLYGRGGSDALYGGYNDDLLYGGEGVDNLNGAEGADLLDGGNGFDFARYDYAASGVTVNLSNLAANTGDAAGDTYVSIEGLVGSAFADTFTGNSGNTLFFGGAGVDTFVFGNVSGVDTIGDFTASGADHDVIKILSGINGSTITSYATLSTHMTQSGADVLIDLGGGNTLTLSNIALAQLSASDFLFV